MKRKRGENKTLCNGNEDNLFGPYLSATKRIPYVQPEISAGTSRDMANRALAIVRRLTQMPKTIARNDLASGLELELAGVRKFRQVHTGQVWMF